MRKCVQKKHVDDGLMKFKLVKKWCSYAHLPLSESTLWEKMKEEEWIVLMTLETR